MTNILIIDDELNIRKLGQTIFSSIGYEVFLAEDGEEGVKKAKEVKPDIILLDVIMPNKNGFDTCVRRIGRRVLIDLDSFEAWVDQQKESAK